MQSHASLQEGGRGRPGDTQGRCYEGRQRDPGMLAWKVAVMHHGGRDKSRVPPEPQGQCGPAHTLIFGSAKLISDSRAPELRE